MPTPAPASAAYDKAPGTEPLPGYRLLAPLGRGGFGEVWKCEAPGGLHKAVKFVAPDPDRPDASTALRQEYEAFQHIKTIRHPFILQLERVELVGGELVMVMELADAQLQDVFNACLGRGLPGIPRDELLGYFADAAEALDVIGAKHGLQHLDVKPANLFLLGGHVKVGDYGLVARLEADDPDAGSRLMNRGLTPRYVAPEVLRGRVDPRSDQYSLALVYQELLTGSYPYPGRTAPQLMFQHVTGTPDLSGLPEADREPVARALAKDPADRFPSCLAFVQALLTAGGPRAVTTTPADTTLDLIRRARVDRSVADLALPAGEPPRTGPPRGEATRQTTPAFPELPTVRALPPLTVPNKPLTPPPPPAAPPGLVTTPVPGFSGPWGAPAGRDADEVVLTPAPVGEPEPVKLKRIHSVVPVSRLLGGPGGKSPLGPDQFVDAVVSAAAGGVVPREPGDVLLLPDGTWSCRFPTSLLPVVVPLKLTPLMEEGWCDEVNQPEPTRLVLRIRAGGGGRGLWGKLAGRPAGAEVVIHLPGGPRPGPAGGWAGPGGGRQSAFALAGAGGRDLVGGTGEVEVAGYVFGSPDADFARKAVAGVPELMREVRRLLQNVPDRRKAPRVPTNGAVTVYPITEDGLVYPPVPAVGRDVSTGGLCCVAQAAVPTRYVFAEFPEVAVTAGLAILTRLTRSNTVGYEQILAGRFRTDL